MRSWKTQWTTCKILFQKTENIEFFQFAIFSDRVHMTFVRFKLLSIGISYLPFINVNFLGGLISFYWCSSNITLKFCSFDPYFNKTIWP
jgi:hypothetical protein